MTENKFHGMIGVASGLVAKSGADIGRLNMKSRYVFECFDKAGNLKWTEEVDNLVVDTGLDAILNEFFKGSAYTASHFVGLKGAGTIAAGDTMASTGSWSELTCYSNANRPGYTPGSVASQSVSNTASKAVFSINTSGAVAGAFLVDNNTKGGSAGILYGAADFGATRSVQSGDTLNVTVTATAS